MKITTVTIPDIVGLELSLPEHQYTSSLGDLQPQLAHVLGLSNQLQDLGVKVHKELLGVGVADQEGGLETGPDVVHRSEPATVVEDLRRGMTFFSICFICLFFFICLFLFPNKTNDIQQSKVYCSLVWS